MQPGVPFWALPDSRAGCWRSEVAEKVEEANGQATGLGHGTGRWAPRGRASGGWGACLANAHFSSSPRSFCASPTSVYTHLTCGSGVRDRKPCALFLPLPSRLCQPILVRGQAGRQLTSAEHRFLRRALLFCGAR